MIVSNFPGGSDVFALPLDGSKEMTGDLKLGGNQIKNIGVPEEETDAARKQEVTDHNKSEDAHANILSDMVKVTGGGTMTMGESIGAGLYTIEMTEEEEGDLSATQVGYNNVATGMAATNVQDAVTELFTSVSNGKSLLAGAITDKGVSTSATDSFSVMAENIMKIRSEELEEPVQFVNETTTTTYVVAYADGEYFPIPVTKGSYTLLKNSCFAFDVTGGFPKIEVTGDYDSFGMKLIGNISYGVYKALGDVTIISGDK